MHFSLPLGARRCTDAARFLEHVGKADAARLFITKAEAFGQAQYQVVQQHWERAAALFDHLAQIEATIVASL
jgi:hypothetical protein